MSKVVFEKAITNMQNNEHSWMATVIYTKGSTPGKIGMKMLINLTNQDSTIGGGAIEQKVIDKIREQKPLTTVKWQFDLDGNVEAEKTGMICGGMQEILIEPLFTNQHLYIIGGGHCGQALSELAAKCHFEVTVIDDRKEYAISKLHPDASHISHIPYGEIEKHINFSTDIYVVIMTHGHKHDKLALQQILGKPYKYLGMIGSKKKTLAIFDQLVAEGYKQTELEKVFAPIGLDIGSETPFEIAISIMGQLLAVKNKITQIKFNSNPLYNQGD
jgi:xanthine dehydrogenase accessory factor